MSVNPPDETLTDVLQSCRRITVVGLSPQPGRPSFGVTRYMANHGYQIEGVRPAVKEILGRPCYETLNDVPGALEMVNVFRASEAIPGLVNEIEEFMKAKPGMGPRVLWLQEGITHPQAEAKARQLGLTVISDRCILKEHRRLRI